MKKITQILNLFSPSKDYEKLSWKELTREARRRGLDPRLTTIKGMEGAAERDMQEIIEQLTIRDQNRNNKLAFYISIVALLLGIFSIFLQFSR
jgi:hypothetical protein